MLIVVCRFIANQLAPITLLGALAAYLYPPLFLVFKDSFLWFFAATMFALGIVLDTAELQETVRHPGRIGLGVLTQFTVMPALGFAAAMLSPLPPEIALGFIIVACAPGAMASNVIVYLAGGAVAFSVAMTTVATFLSPVLTPALVEVAWQCLPGNPLLADDADHHPRRGVAAGGGDGGAAGARAAP